MSTMSTRTQITVTELDDLINQLRNLSLNSPTTRTITSSGSEVKLFMPKPFTGKRTELKRFLQDALVYLLVNKEIYDNDQKKVAFVLSFMTEGAAGFWKEDFLTRVFEDADKNNAEPNLGTFSAFKKAVEESFSPYDAPGDAIDEMRKLRMTSQSSLDEHIARFKNLVTQSGLEADSVLAEDLFQKSLTLPLLRRLLNRANPPSTLSEWYKMASRLHNIDRKLQDTRRRNNEAPGPGQKNGLEKKTFFHKLEPKDSNTMPLGVDLLCSDERIALMKKGACFRCKKIGHLSKDCPDKNTNKRT